MLKFGVVTSLDAANCRVRVRFSDNEDLESYWLAVLQAKTQLDKHYALPDSGEHVACLMDENLEEGVVLGALYSSAESPPVASADKSHLEFSDGGWMQYDRASHTLSLDLPGGELRLKAAGSLNVELGGGCVLKSAAGSTLRLGANSVIACDGDLDIDCRGRLRLRSQLPMHSYMPANSFRFDYQESSPQEPANPEK